MKNQDKNNCLEMRAVQSHFWGDEPAERSLMTSVMRKAFLRLTWS